MDFLKNRSHESFDRKEKFSLGSDKKFGFTFALIFLFLALFFNVSPAVKVIFAVVGLAFATISTLNPIYLHQLNVLWGRFGLILSKIVSPLVLGILFYLVFMPVGLLLKISGKDILNKKINKNLKTYWINSNQTLTSSMKDQF